MAPLDATAEEVLFSKDDEGRMGEDVDGMLRTQELGGQGACHAVREVVDCKVDFVRGSGHCCCVEVSLEKKCLSYCIRYST